MIGSQDLVRVSGLWFTAGLTPCVTWRSLGEFLTATQYWVGGSACSGMVVEVFSYCLERVSRSLENSY